MITTDTDILYTTVEAAERLGTTAKALNNWRAIKRYPQLKPIKIGKNVFYSHENINNFLQNLIKTNKKC